MRRLALLFLLIGCAPRRETPAEHLAVGRASVDVPASANGEIRLEDTTTKMAVRFSLVGATDAPLERVKVAGEGSRLRVQYRGALASDADLVLQAAFGGVEDSIRFPRKPARESTFYDVDVAAVAGLRLVANVLEFLDSGGAPRLRVTSPFVLDANDAKHVATLSVHACAVDTDPRPPWNRAVTHPGASRCKIEVSWAGLGVVYPAVVDPAWSTTAGLLAQVHQWPSAAVLPSKRVMLVGSKESMLLSEIFDPATGTWASAGNMNVARTDGCAVVLDSGDVLAIGGYEGGNASERYNETRGTWLPTKPLAGGGRGIVCAKLPGGKVLEAANGSATAELYDPVADTWTNAGTMGVARDHAVGAALPDGTVLVAGGSGATGSTNAAEIFTPPSTWTPVPSMAFARYEAAATALRDGRVLVTGGSNDIGYLRDAEIYDPKTQSWSSAGKYFGPRSEHTSLLLSNGKVLITGGYIDQYLSSTNVYDPAQNLWVSSGDLSVQRCRHTSTALEGGRALVAGVENTKITEVFEPLAVSKSCRADGECETGFCVEGTCCDTRCDAPCVACTAKKKGAGDDGRCGPVPAGTPHPDCPSLPASTCGGTGKCDGAGACALQASGVSCGRDVCEASALTTARCSGRGVCSQKIQSCKPYSCASSTACGKDRCTSDAECADTFWCNREACVPSGCDGDHVVVGAEHDRKDCTPYRCDTQGCRSSCRSSTDCVEPFVCNAEHVCIPGDQALHDGGSGGCACDVARGGPRRDGWLAIMPLALVLLLRRRGKPGSRTP